MSSWNAAGKIQTVLGLIEPTQLGVTLTHEHLLIDLTAILEPPIESSARYQYYAEMTPESLGKVRYYGEINYANYQVLDVETAIEEANLYKQFGGTSMVDATSIGIARDPTGLARISRATGLNVIMGASFYVNPAHPDYVATSPADILAEQIVNDVTKGADGSTIRSGIIGEVGCSWPLTESERKVLIASAQAQRATGAPILIHPGRDEASPMEIIEVLDRAGANLNKTIIGHLDRTVFQKETLTQIGQSGCFFEWDLFGKESSTYPANPSIDHPNDATKLQHISWLIAQGYGNKITVAHDICTNHRLSKYGGHGYFYILKHIVPLMQNRGFDEESIQSILVHNPAAALTFVDPA